jgi:hypothetical protein
MEGVEVQLYSFFNLGARCKGVVNAALPQRKTHYPLYRRLDGPQGQSGQVWKISPPLGSSVPKDNNMGTEL